MFVLAPLHSLGLDSQSKLYVLECWVISLTLYLGLIQTNYHQAGIGQKKSVKYIISLKKFGVLRHFQMFLAQLGNDMGLNPPKQRRKFSWNTPAETNHFHHQGPHHFHFPVITVNIPEFSAEATPSGCWICRVFLLD